MREINIKGEKVAAITSKEGEFYGRLFWFSIGHCEVPIDDMVRLYQKYNLDEKLLPPEPREKDVFKVATKLMESVDEDVINGEPVSIIYMVRAVGALRRALVREVHLKEGDKGRLEYDIVGYWEYNEEIVRILENERFKDLFTAKTKELENKFNYLLSIYTDKQIRDKLRNIIYAMPTISLRESGGVYFIPENKENIQILEGLANVLEEINKKYTSTDYTTELVYIPVVTTEPNKKMIIRKYEIDAKEKLEKLFSEIQEILDSDKEIPSGKFTALLKEITKIKETKKVYESLLENDLEIVEEQIQILNTKIDALASKVKA